jgi:hypothetical protein
MPCPDAVIAAAQHPHEVAEAMAERQAAGEPAEMTLRPRCSLADDR